LEKNKENSARLWKDTAIAVFYYDLGARRVFGTVDATRSGYSSFATRLPVARRAADYFKGKNPPRNEQYLRKVSEGGRIKKTGEPQGRALFSSRRTPRLGSLVGEEKKKRKTWVCMRKAGGRSADRR